MKIQISKKLLLAFLLVSTIPLLIGGIIAQTTAKGYEEKRAAIRLENDVSALGERVSVFVLVAVRDSYQLANSLIFGSKDIDKTSALLKNARLINPSFTKFRLFNTEGIVVAAADRTDMGRSITEQPEELQHLFFKATKAKTYLHYLSEPGEAFKRADKHSSDTYGNSKYRSAGTARTMDMHLFIPLFDANDIRTGILQTSFGTHYVLDLLASQTPVTGNENLLIVDKYNRIIFSHGQKRAAGDLLKTTYLKLLADLPAIELYERKQARRVNILDEEFLASTVLIPETDRMVPESGWRLIALQPYGDIIHGINSGWQKAAYPLWGLLALIITAALWLSRSISRPIRLLVRSAEAVASGNYSAPVEDSNTTEVSVLANAFNSMAQAVATKERSLETEIAERKAAQAQLYELQSRQALILNGAGDGLLCIDAIGKISFINPAGAHILGTWVEELVGMNICKLVDCSATSETPGPCLKCPMSTSLPLSERKTYEAFFKRDDGQRIPVEYVISPLTDHAGNSAGAVLVFRDTSQRKETRETAEKARNVSELPVMRRVSF